MSQPDDLTVNEMLTFIIDRIEKEKDEFPGELPEHAARMTVSRANDILQTTVQRDMRRSNDDVDGPAEEDIREAIESDIVDLLFAIGALQVEYELDVEAAFVERKEMIEDYLEFVEAIENADDEDDKIEAFDEHMDNKVKENPFTDSVGKNVDAEDYEHEEKDRSYQ